MPVPIRLDANFLMSAPNLAGAPPPTCPEVAFVGRSNAGKSSVLNQITGNRRMAKVSRTPGRTQLLNFFDVRTGGRVVDLPGYGFAKAGKIAQRTWQTAVNAYLEKRDALVGLVLVMDIRHPDQAFDQDLIGWCGTAGLACRVLLNKADKLSYSRQRQALQHMQGRYAAHPHVSMQLFSALKGNGRDELIALLLEWLAAEPVSEPDPS